MPPLKKLKYKRLGHFISTIMHVLEHLGNLYSSEDLPTILIITLRILERQVTAKTTKIDACIADSISGKI